MSTLEAYLKVVEIIHSTGAAVPETSYYPALSNLLNNVGKSLKLKVYCVINLQNRGAGIPDGGLFTPDQIQKGEPDRDRIEGLDTIRGELCTVIQHLGQAVKDMEDEIDRLERPPWMKH